MIAYLLYTKCNKDVKYMGVFTHISKNNNSTVCPELFLYISIFIQIPNYRYPKQCYNMLQSLALGGKTNWALNVRLLLHKHGFRYVWEADTIGDASRFIHLFRQRLADCFTQQWHSEVEEY